MNKNYIYISVGWISFAAIIWAIVFAAIVKETTNADIAKTAMQEGYQQERVESGAYTDLVYRKIDK